MYYNNIIQSQISDSAGYLRTRLKYILSSVGRARCVCMYVEPPHSPVGDKHFGNFANHRVHRSALNYCYYYYSRVSCVYNVAHTRIIFYYYYHKRICFISSCKRCCIRRAVAQIYQCLSTLYYYYIIVNNNKIHIYASENACARVPQYGIGFP